MMWSVFKETLRVRLGTELVLSYCNYGNTLQQGSLVDYLVNMN